GDHGGQATADDVGQDLLPRPAGQTPRGCGGLPRVEDVEVPAAAACPLAATWWTSSVSVASALRWLLPGFVAAASIPLWTRRTVRERLSRFAIALDDNDPIERRISASLVRDILFGLILFSYLAMGLYVSFAAVQKSGVPSPLDELLHALAVLAVVALLVAAVIGQAKPGRSTGEQGTARVTHVQVLVLLLGCGPFVITSGFIVATALRQHPLVGPEPGAWFREVGWSISYGVPLVVFALTLVGHAAGERVAGLAFAAGLLFNLVATMVFLLELARALQPLDGSAWVEAAQINSLVCSVVALLWMAAVLWHRRRHHAVETENPPPNGWPGLLTSQVLMAASLFALPVAAAVASLVVHPVPRAWVSTAGAPLGWVAAAVALAAAWVWRAGRPKVFDEHFWAAVFAAGVVFIALVFAWRQPGEWVAYHALIAGFAAASWAMSLAYLTHRANAQSSTALPPASRLTPAASWSAIFGAITVVVALRALAGDPDSPWWTLAALAATAALAVHLAWISLLRGFLWVAGLLVHLAVSIWWLEAGSALITASPRADQWNLPLINVMAAAAMAIVSVVVEFWRIQPATLTNRWSTVRFHQFAAWACIAMITLAVLFGLSHDFAGTPVDWNPWLYGGALLATALANVACLWDTTTRFVVAALYGVGLAGAGMVLDAMDISGDRFLWAVPMLLSAYALVTSLLWRLRHSVIALGAQCRVPLALQMSDASAAGPRLAGGFAWMTFANGLLVAVVTVLVFWIEVTIPDSIDRTLAARALLGAAVALGLLAHESARSPLRVMTLMLGVLFAVALGWSQLRIPIQAELLHRAAVAAVAMAVMIPVYAIGVVKLLPRAKLWNHAARQVVPLLTAFTAVALVGVLAIEVLHFADEELVPLAWPVRALLLAAFVGLAAAALVAAVLPGRDPLGFSERGRTAYVYAAEILLMLAFVHIRVTMPWLFHGWFTRHWPLVIMAIAFIGVGFAELCRRRNLRVLSEPLENTGALLPLLPAVGFWLLPSQVNYSLLLLSVGALYSVLCVLRKSFMFGVMATLAANGSLWAWLYSAEGLSLWQHPQLWLIPPALCVLVAAYLNRARLSHEQFTAVRYLSAIVIYASSTADVFVNGVGEAPYLPLVLGAISLVGIFAGILLEVRGFLYLGVSFLLVALFTVIWHAAVELDRTWIWWVTGIVTGALIIALFGLFEKKRDDMLALVERMKQWDG
ncbi:MAG: hypothetical protein WD176_04135, partial [Pirellulales bacterium]